MDYFDSHIHLTDIEYSHYLDDMLFSLRAMKIKACSVTVNLNTTKRGLIQFSEKEEIISQFVGIHPEYAINEDFGTFHELVKSNIDRIDGIGEIGLDPTYSNEIEDSYKIQIKMFHNLLSLAEKYNKPISIHSRKSLDDILQILTTYNIKNRVLHWFAGSKKQLKKAMEMELYVSYGPTLLYSPDKKTLISNSHADKILVETDGPVRYSRCFNYIPASSLSSIISVINQMSEIINQDFYETAKLLKSNSENFLGKKI